MLRLDAFAYRVRKRLRATAALAKAAAEIREVHPAEEGVRPPAFWLPDQLDKVRATQEETNFEYELQRIHGGAVTHAATIEYRVDQGRMVNGVFYGGGTRIAQAHDPESLWPQKVTEHVAECSLPSSFIGSRYFGHFVTDDACTALLARDFAPPLFAGTRTPMSEHVQRYLELYGLAPTRLRSARIDKAWFFQDFGMNAGKRARFEQMRTCVRALPGHRSGHGVFFRRGTSGVRRGYENEAALEERLSREGFDIIDVTVDAIDDIIRRSRDAAIVCGVEGSALAHGLLAMAPGASLLCLMPPYRFNNVFKDHCDALGMRYGFVVGEGERGAFTVNVDEVLKTLDLARPLAA